MRVLFVVPNKKLIPSGIVRVLSWQKYLAADGNFTAKIVNHENTLIVKAGHLMLPSNPGFQPGAFRRIGMKCLLLVNFIQKNILYWKLGFNAGRFEIFFFQWAVVPEWVLDKISANKAKIIFDFDDAVFLKKPRETEYMIRHADHVIAGSHYLYEYAKKHNASTIFMPNAVELRDFSWRPATRRPVRIGWIGSRSTVENLSLVSSPLNELKRRGHEFELLVAGCGRGFAMADLSPAIGLKVIPAYRYDDIPAILSDIDIGIMPLYDSPWERGKSAMKAILYMAAYKPVIASSVGEATYVIKDGYNGFLVKNDREWETALEKLLLDEGLREKMGRAGRKYAEENHSLEDYYKKIYAGIFKKLMPDRMESHLAR